MNVTMYDMPQAFEALKADWNDLLARSYTNIIFSTWEWQKHWWDAYQEGELLIIGFRSGGGVLLGIASFFIAKDDEGKKVLAFVGSEDVTDYLDLIIDHEHTEEVLRCLSGVLQENRSRYDVIRLCNIPDDSPTLTHFAPLLESFAPKVEITPHEVCPLFVLPKTLDGYFDSLDSKQARELKRKLRRAEGSGDMAWYIVDDSHDLNAELERFLKLMAKSHPQKARFLENPKHVAFFKVFMPVAYEKGWLQLNFETVLETPVATYLNFVYRNDLLVYNSGLDPEAYGALSPGIILLVNNIEYAIKQGKNAFNFLRGNESYKYLMGAKDSTIYQIKAHLS